MVKAGYPVFEIIDCRGGVNFAKDFGKTNFDNPQKLWAIPIHIRYWTNAFTQAFKVASDQNIFSQLFKMTAKSNSQGNLFVFKKKP